MSVMCSYLKTVTELFSLLTGLTETGCFFVDVVIVVMIVL